MWQSGFHGSPDLFQRLRLFLAQLKTSGFVSPRVNGPEEPRRMRNVLTLKSKEAR